MSKRTPDRLPFGRGLLAIPSHRHSQAGGNLGKPDGLPRCHQGPTAKWYLEKDRCRQPAPLAACFAVKESSPINAPIHAFDRGTFRRSDAIAALQKIWANPGDGARCSSGRGRAEITSPKRASGPDGRAFALGSNFKTAQIETGRWIGLVGTKAAHRPYVWSRPNHRLVEQNGPYTGFKANSRDSVLIFGITGQLRRRTRRCS